jgi:ABC-type dipeptide/oligopeptide/nickel transport systems, permease components
MTSTLFLPETWMEELPGYDFLMHLALPLLTASLHFVADPMMIMRTSMIDVSKEDFATFAKSTGIRDSGIRRLTKRNAILPVLTYISIMVGFAFGGQVLLEVLFSWPGMGRVMVTAVEHRDYPVAQAAFFFMAVLVIMTNFLIDIAYSIIDPRIQLD